MPDLLSIDRDASVITVTLNRPDQRNALNAALVEELTTFFQEDLVGIDSRTDMDPRVVVLTGAGRVFSAGADLKSLRALRDASPMENRADSKRLAALFESIYTLERPVIAKINGHAIAGGCGLASVCDLAYAAKDAKLGFTETRIGFVPAIVMVYVQRKVGASTLRDLMLRGRLVQASEAVDMGLINAAVPAADLDAHVRSIADEISRETSASAVALTKSMMGQIDGMGRREAIEFAADVNAFARSTDDCIAGIQAFLDKQDPPWKQSWTAHADDT